MEKQNKQYWKNRENLKKKYLEEQAKAEKKNDDILRKKTSKLYSSLNPAMVL